MAEGGERIPYLVCVVQLAVVDEHGVPVRREHGLRAALGVDDDQPAVHERRVGVGVGFVRQCGVVLGHEQLECLQRCAADGVGHGAFNAALLDAGVHNFACVVGQA